MKEFRLTPHLCSYTLSREIVKGYYVYLWLDSGKIFYVGMGAERRAWNEHLPHVESIRQSSISFKVRILRDCMSKPMAHRYERYITQRLLRQGIKLVNKKVAQC